MWLVTDLRRDIFLIQFEDGASIWTDILSLNATLHGHNIIFKSMRWLSDSFFKCFSDPAVFFRFINVTVWRMFEHLNTKYLLMISSFISEAQNCPILRTKLYHVAVYVFMWCSFIFVNSPRFNWCPRNSRFRVSSSAFNVDCNWSPGVWTPRFYESLRPDEEDTHCRFLLDIHWYSFDVDAPDSVISVFPMELRNGNDRPMSLLIFKTNDELFSFRTADS